jgi:hypothetical protein
VREATLACVRLTAFAASTGSVCKSSGSASSGIGRCSLVESTSQMIGVGAAHRSKQRPPRTPPRISARLPQPRQLLRQITPRDRRLQTPTTPSIAMSRKCLVATQEGMAGLERFKTIAGVATSAEQMAQQIYRLLSNASLVREIEESTWNAAVDARRDFLDNPPRIND